MEENYAFSRVKKVLDLLQITANQFEIEVGWSRGMIQKIKTGGSLTMESVKKVFTRFPEISPIWWFHDIDPVLIEPNFLKKYNSDAYLNAYQKAYLSPEKSVKSGLKQGLNIQTGPPLVVTVDSQGRENISLVSAKAFAGYASSLHEPTYLTTLPTFRLPFPEFLNATFRAFQVSGPSMEPTLYNGEWLIGQFVENWPQSIREGYIYIIVTTETVLVKRVLNRISVRNQVVIQSDNESFPTDFLEPEQIREMWYLKAKIGFQFPNPRYDIHRKIANLEADVETLRRQLSGESNN
jgi:phage repressor protein C with HTH and peptisase S24 domain